MKKRLWFMAIVMLLCGILLSTEVSAIETNIIANGVCGENLTWVLDAEGTLTISGEGEMTYYSSSLDIPWVWYKQKIHTLVVGEGITTISKHIFENCDNLKTILLPKTLLSIGFQAFSGCDNLKDITIEDGLTSIDSYAFEECISITSIVLPDTLIEMGSGVFSNCSSLMEILVNDTDEIGYRSEDGVLYYYDKTLETNSLICYPIAKSQDSYTIIENTTHIATSAFEGCTNLSEIVFSDDLVEIGMWAFKNCDSLTEISFKSNLNTIKRGAFYSCDNLKIINIPNSVIDIHRLAFSDCTSLEQIIVDDTDMIGYRSVDGVLYEFVSPKKYYLVSYPNGKKDTVFTVIDNTREIFEGAFEKCQNLEEIVFPENLREIEQRAFGDCKNLKKISFNDELESIGPRAFENCIGLTEIALPESLKDLDSAFCDCSGLVSVIFPDELEIIGSFAFDGCTNLKDFQLPESLTTIEYAAFARCNGLKNVVLPKGLEVLESDVFLECENLESVTLPNSVTLIEDNSFRLCTALKQIKVDDIDGIGYRDIDGVLYNYDENSDTFSLICYPIAKNEHSYTIIDKTVSIGENAFWACTNLIQINMPQSMESIKNYAFIRCYNLKYVKFSGNAPELVGTVFREVDSDFTIYYTKDTLGWSTPVWNGYPAYPFPSSSDEILLGDVNGDYSVNKIDLTILIRYFAGWNGYAEQILYPQSADLNGDGVMTRSDVMLLARQLAGWNQ